MEITFQEDKFVCVECARYIAKEEISFDLSQNEIDEMICVSLLWARDNYKWTIDSREREDIPFSHSACDFCNSQEGGYRHHAILYQEIPNHTTSLLISLLFEK